MADEPYKIPMISGSKGYRKNYIDEVQTFFMTTMENNFGTFDGARLNQWEEHDVFVPGTMKQGFSQHSVLKGEEDNARCIGIGYTVSTMLKMFRTKSETARTEPIIFACPKETKVGRVFGEVWRVPTKRVFALDYFNENGTYLRRTKVPIHLSKPGRPDQRMVQPCWMYFGVRDWWDTRMEQLELCDLLQPNDKNQNPYYLFMKKYEQEWERSIRKAA